MHETVCRKTLLMYVTVFVCPSFGILDSWRVHCLLNPFCLPHIIAWFVSLKKNWDTNSFFSLHFVCETVCLKIAKGTTDPWLENCQKNFLNNYNKLLTSKLRALIKKFCRQAVKMLLSICQL